MLHRLFMCGGGGAPTPLREADGWWPPEVVEKALTFVAAWESSSDSTPIIPGGGILEVQELDAITWMLAEKASPFIAAWEASGASSPNPTPPEPPPSVGLAVGVRHLPPPPDTGYETSIGRSPDVWVDYCAGDSDAYLNGSWAWLIPNPNSSANLDNYNANFASNNKRLHIQLGLCPWGGATRGSSTDNSAMLAEVANGDHDAKWAQFATAMKNLFPNLVNRPIYLGLGWEMNYTWSPWKVFTTGGTFSSTNAANFAAAFRHIHDAVKNAEPGIDWRFVFIPGSEAWRLSSWYPSRINLMYPGDAYVYAIGSDQYDGSGAGQYTTPPTDAQRTLVWNTEHLVALTNQNAFAVAHGNKPQCFGEWGIWHSIGSSTLGGDDNPGFINNIYDWVTNPAHKYEHVAYFNRNVSGFVEHSLTSFGTLSKANARAAYIATFGQHPHPF